MEEDLSSGKLESTHPSITVVKSIEVFMESSQLYQDQLELHRPGVRFAKLELSGR